MQLLEPEANVDIPLRDYDYKDVYEKAKIACATALRLNEMGMPIELEEEDDLFAKQVITQEVKPTTKQIFKPGVAIKLGALLEEYEVQVAKDAAQLRTVATNKLIEMLDDPDPKVRLKSVELIGKIADVGLFAERTQITIINKSTEELERELVGLFKDYVDVEAREVTKVEQLMSEEVQDVEEIKAEEQEVEEVDAEDK
jgi:hypothetical protein